MSNVIRLGANRDTTTGFTLVMGESSDAVRAALASTNVGVIRSASVATAEETETSVVLFDRLGVAVVPRSKAPGVMSTMAAAGFQHVEPERKKFAISRVNADYLRGYRDGVSQIVDRLLAGAPESEDVSCTKTRPEEMTWGLQETYAGLSPFTGRGTKVAILDTGLDLLHEDFEGRPIQYQSFVPGKSVQDGNGHGTHVAGIACGPRHPRMLPRYGVASDADLYIGKVLDDDGAGRDAWVIAGIEWAINQGCRIISLSLGSPSPPSAVYREIGIRALEANVLIIAAAGNESHRQAGEVMPLVSPANCGSMAAIAALDRQMGVADFSCAGGITVSAPGVDIYSSYPLPDAYNRLDGTSMATPYVAGIAALMMQARPTATARQILDDLKSTAKRLPLLPSDVGSGLVQAPRSNRT